LIDVVLDIIRAEEQLIISALKERFSESKISIVNLREVAPKIGSNDYMASIAIIRPISMLNAAYAAALYEAKGSLVINSSETIIFSGDKVLTYTRLAAHKLPLPPTLIAFAHNTARTALRELGVPLVVKPPLGSWGRLVTRIRSARELEYVLAHREAMRTPHQKIIIMQKYVDTGNKDIRCIVIEEELVGCIERRAKQREWRSNVALGADTKPYKPTNEVEDLSLRAAAAVKGFFVSVDLFQTKDGLLVNEVNAVPEFKGFMRATGINPARILVEKLYQMYKK